VSLAAAQITLSASRPVRSGLDSTPPFVINGKAPQATFYAEGSELYAQGDRAQGIYQVAFGAVRVFRILADGRRRPTASSPRRSVLPACACSVWQPAPMRRASCFRWR
jgi:hypothetical protein